MTTDRIRKGTYKRYLSRLITKIYKELIKLNKIISNPIKNEEKNQTHLSREDIQMADRHMKGAQNHRLSAKYKPKTTMSYYLTALGMTSNKKEQKHELLVRM